MIRIMFVCHGNICRSPMAEFIMKDLVKKRGLQDQFIIESSAISTEEIGNFMYSATKAQLKKKGIEYTERRAVQLKSEDYNKYDHIICMDRRNLYSIQKIITNDHERKIKKLLDYTNGKDIDDPWYTGRFDIAFDDILSGCEAFLDKLI